MESVRKMVVFNLDEQRYALDLAAVERIVMVVEITALPNAPRIVTGVVNFQGRITPVVDIRKRFNLPAREMSLSDHLIVARTSRRMVALAVDGVAGVLTRPQEEITAGSGILPGLEHVEGVVKLEDGLILIHNLETFLSLEEESILDQAMASI